MPNPEGINQYTKGGGSGANPKIPEHSEHGARMGEKARQAMAQAQRAMDHSRTAKTEGEHHEASAQHRVAANMLKAVGQHEAARGHVQAMQQHHNTARQIETMKRNDAAVQARTAPGNVPGPSMNSRFGRW